MNKKITTLAFIALLTALSGCGGSDTTTTTTAGSGNDDTPDDVPDPIADVDNIGLGTGVGNAHLSGQAATGLDDGEILSPSGSTTVSVNIVNIDDNNSEFLGLRDVFFISTCTQTGLAEFTPATVKASGVADATYKDKGCGKTDGFTDNVVVYIGTQDEEGNITAEATARTTIDVGAAQIGAIQYIAATPSTIALNGFGTNDTPSLSTIEFQVVDESGNPMPDREVRFVLDHEYGNAALSLNSASTDQEGKVKVILNAGNASGSVRVKASVDILDDSDVVTETITTLSIPIVMATSLGDQNSFTLSADVFNPAGWNFSGSEVNFTVHLGDHYQNPVLDGTTVYFRSTAGIIEPSCDTKGGTGSCSVVWTSSNPRPVDGYATITAFTRGQGDFQDANGDGLFGIGDGENVSGESFTTYGEDFVDANGNGKFDLIGISLDANGDIIETDKFGTPTGADSAKVVAVRGYQPDLDVDNDGKNEFGWSPTSYKVFVDQDGTPTYTNDSSNFFEEMIDSNNNGILDLVPENKYQGVNCTDLASEAGHCAEQIDLVRSLRIELSQGDNAYIEGPFLWDSTIGRFDTDTVLTCVDVSVQDRTVGWRVSDHEDRRNHLPVSTAISLSPVNLDINSQSGTGTLLSYFPAPTLSVWDEYWLGEGGDDWESEWDARYNLDWSKDVANIGRSEADQTADRNAERTALSAEIAQEKSDSKRYQYLEKRGHIISASIGKPTSWEVDLGQLKMGIKTVKGPEISTTLATDVVGYQASLIESNAQHLDANVNGGP